MIFTGKSMPMTGGNILTKEALLLLMPRSIPNISDIAGMWFSRLKMRLWINFEMKPESVLTSILKIPAFGSIFGSAINYVRFRWTAQGILCIKEAIGHRPELRLLTKCWLRECCSMPDGMVYRISSIPCVEAEQF